MRTLVYVPMLHTEVDLGSAASELRAALQHLRAPGQPDVWSERQTLLREMWRGIAVRLDEMNLPYATTRVYQDGLPICGREEAIVNELAERGSLNHRLIVALQQRGAQLMGTEDPALLIGEYERLQRLKALWQVSTTEEAAEGSAEQEEQEELLRAEGEALLRQRDTFIAGRIEQTLQQGETAVVFLGLLHRVDEHFVGCCDLRLIIHNLPFWSDLNRDRQPRSRSDSRDRPPRSSSDSRDPKERVPHGRT